jgi:predicted Fe-Mo cluster-binding NifX family protein
MFTALPLQGLSLANHFTKATSFAIYDQQGVLVKQLDNPALESGCDGKSRLVEMLGVNQVSQVIVKNIGERMLGKLLDCNMLVRQVNLRGGDIATIFSQIAQFPELNEASQGRESVNYHKKQQQGGCCSHEHAGEHHTADKKSCCGSRHGSGRGGCCKH